jgi:hypothetical protein
LPRARAAADGEPSCCASRTTRSRTRR